MQMAHQQRIPGGAPDGSRPGAPTPQQQAAVAHSSGPARILAGAGTGKTRVMVARFHHLVAQGVAPERILALTFSKEAARSLRDAILLGLRAGTRLWVSTFHSFCLSLLEREGAADLRLVQESESRALLTNLCQHERWGWYTGAAARRLVDEALTLIGQAKDQLLTPDDVARYAAAHSDARLADLARAYRLFQDELQRTQGAEFADFITRAVGLLERDPALAVRWQARFDHILVDEFQDTNLAQFRVLQTLARPHGNLVVVGDDDQAIYHFRGATDRFLVDFDQYFPGAATYKVEENFRCPQPVLDVANRLIAQNAGARVDKTLFTKTRCEGYPPVALWEAGTEQEEAEFIAAEIARRLGQGAARPEDFAILCRSLRRGAGEITRALARRGIPYQQAGDAEEHPLVAQTLALLRLTRTLRTADLLPVLAAQVPPADLHAALRESGGDLGALVQAGGGPPACQQAGAALQAWLQAHAGDPLPLLVYEALRFLGHLRLSLALTVADADRLAAARSLQEQAATTSDLDAFLAGASVQAGWHPGPAVTVMTVHAAKGLEFPVVFVPGLAEGRFPVAVDTAPVFYTAEAIRDWVNDPGAVPLLDPAGRLAQHIKEERRLAYVALTRARNELIVSRARSYGGEVVEPSRFLAELGAPPPELVGEHGADRLPAARDYLVRVATGVGAPDPQRLAAAAAALADPAAVPLRRQAEPAPFAGNESLDLSATALEQYRECPRQYYYSRVLGLQDEETVALAFGSAVHGVLEQLHAARRAGAWPPWSEVEAWWTTALPRDPFETEGQYRQYCQRGQGFLDRYYRWAVAQPWAVVATEQAFRIPYTDRQGRTHRVRGRYDLVVRGPEGLQIIDFKSGKRSYVVNKTLRGTGDLHPQRKLQLGLYYLAYFGGAVDPGARVTYIFLRHEDDRFPGQLVAEFDQKGEQVISAPHTPETLQALRDTIDDVIDGILANRFERTTDLRTCERCPFRGPCEVSPVDWF